MRKSSLLTASLLALSIGFPAAMAREIDNHAGIFFFCKPLANEAWTARSCEEMGARMVALAGVVQKPIVLLKIGDTREKYPELAKAKGFDSNRAVWFLISIDPHAQNKGQWELAARADVTNRTPSASGQPQVATYSRKATAASSSEVADKGKQMLDSIMLALAAPTRP